MNGRMIFTPADPTKAVPRPRLEQALRTAGFLGAELPADLPGWRNYRAGETFLQHLSFMGCSPHLRFEPGEAGEKFCFLRLTDPWEQPRLLRGDERRPPRCPRCGSACRPTPEDYDAWAEGATTAPVACPQCDARFSPLDLNWRQTAGFCRSPLVVEDVFPGEAVPTAGFEGILRGLGVGGWQWFYMQASSPESARLPE